MYAGFPQNFKVYSFYQTTKNDMTFAFKRDKLEVKVFEDTWAAALFPLVVSYLILNSQYTLDDN